MRCVWVINKAHNALMIMDIYLTGVKWATVSTLCVWAYRSYFPFYFPCLTIISWMSKCVLPLFVSDFLWPRIDSLSEHSFAMSVFIFHNIVTETFSGLMKMKSFLSTKTICLSKSYCWIAFFLSHVYQMPSLVWILAQHSLTCQVQLRW